MIIDRLLITDVQQCRANPSAGQMSNKAVVKTLTVIKNHKIISFHATSSSPSVALSPVASLAEGHPYLCYGENREDDNADNGGRK